MKGRRIVRHRGSSSYCTCGALTQNIATCAHPSKYGAKECGKSWPPELAKGHDKWRLAAPMINLTIPPPPQEQAMRLWKDAAVAHNPVGRGHNGTSHDWVAVQATSPVEPCASWPTHQQGWRCCKPTAAHTQGPRDFEPPQADYYPETRGQSPLQGPLLPTSLLP